MANGRYSRHELVEQIGAKAKEMRTKTVTVVGLSGVGSAVAEMLVRSGIGIRIVDKGRILEHDLHQTTLFLEEDLDKFKAKQGKKRLEDINKTVPVKSFHEDLNEVNIYLIDSDLVIDCSNDLAVSLKIDKYCSKKKIPMIHCFVSGTQGQVFIMNNASISGLTKYVKNKKISEQGILVATIHIAAGIAAAQAAKILLKMPVEKNMITFDVWNGSFEKTLVKKSK
ncbi:MAG: ThiF family adenylyltransferase [Candidatus Woesearchaeota archaeon]|jgi:molybdopterin/thiamine biosynthesis adenylyltransferase